MDKQESHKISQSTHWQEGKEMAQRYMATQDADEKIDIAKYCEEQGILAAIVCLILQVKASPDAAKGFIQQMITIVEEA